MDNSCLTYIDIRHLAEYVTSDIRHLFAMHVPDVFYLWQRDYAYRLWKDMWKEYDIPFPYLESDFSHKIRHFCNKSQEPVQMVIFGFPKASRDGDVEMMVVVRPVQAELFAPIYSWHLSICMVRKKNRWLVLAGSTKDSYKVFLGFYKRSPRRIEKMISDNYDILVAATQVSKQHMLGTINRK